MTFDRAIGGEMAIAPADFMARGGGGGWPGFAGRHHVRCDSGRTALGLAVAHWCAQGRRPSAVWLPDYLCHSVAAGVLRAGVPLRFYEDSRTISLNSCHRLRTPTILSSQFTISAASMKGCCPLHVLVVEAGG